MSDEQPSSERESVPAPTPEKSRPPGFIRNFVKNLRNGRNGDPTLRETFEEIIEQHEENDSSVDPTARAMIDKVLTVGALTVSDVRIPRADIIAVEETIERDALVNLMAAEAHSRMPVYRETLDEVIGMVHIKDVLASLAAGETFDIRKLMRKILFVTGSMRVLDLLLQMRLDRTHMAMVVDEYGGTDGLVTIEDLVEEIVGEIEDEHDEAPAPALNLTGDGGVEADARTEIEALESHFSVTLRDSELDEDIETVGGLVSRLAGRVPLKHDRLRHPSGLTFEIIDADPRRVKRVRVSAATAPDETGTK